MKGNLRLKIMVVSMLLLWVMALGGCAGKQEENAPPPLLMESVQTQPAESSNAVKTVKEPQQPERDPFIAAEAMLEQNRDPLIEADITLVEEPVVMRERDGDPFVLAAALPLPDISPQEPVVVPGQSRDPFDPAADVPLPGIRPEEPVIIQPDPVDPEEPIDPVDPVEPADPGEIGTPGMVAVRLTAVDRCWLEVFVDGQLELRTNVPRGDMLSYEGKEVRLEQVGREWALVLSLNGKNLGTLDELMPALQQGPLTYDFEETRIRVTLGQRYAGGVLVGLTFTVINN